MTDREQREIRALPLPYRFESQKTKVLPKFFELEKLTRTEWICCCDFVKPWLLQSGTIRVLWKLHSCVFLLFPLPPPWNDGVKHAKWLSFIGFTIIHLSIIQIHERNCTFFTIMQMERKWNANLKLRILILFGHFRIVFICYSRLALHIRNGWSDLKYNALNQ